jgi:hypothetical protein
MAVPEEFVTVLALQVAYHQEQEVPTPLEGHLLLNSTTAQAEGIRPPLSVVEAQRAPEIMKSEGITEKRAMFQEN